MQPDIAYKIVLYGTHKGNVKITEKHLVQTLINMSHKQQKHAEEMASFCCKRLLAKKLIKNKWARNRKNNYMLSNGKKKICG